ncbi:hypothetical protein MTO96_006712 [Rhipicephalus appendiculatus]
MVTTAGLRYSCESAYGAARIRTADMEHGDLRPPVMNQSRRLRSPKAEPPSGCFKKMELYTCIPSPLDKLDWGLCAEDLCCGGRLGCDVGQAGVKVYDGMQGSALK